MSELRKFAKQRGAELIERPNGHYQIRGHLLVNYYPDSPKRTAYIAGTRKRVSHVTPKQAVDMAFSAPRRSDNTPRKYTVKQAKRWKRYLLARQPYCRWCKTPLTLETATLEHIIPRARGGLDNMNNFTLACQPCNAKRGHDMPELREGE